MTLATFGIGDTLLVAIAAASVLTLVVIVIAPWKEVRQEPPIDPYAEAKLLLHQDPDEPTGEFRTISSIDQRKPDETDPTTDFGVLGELDGAPPDGEDRPPG